MWDGRTIHAIIGFFPTLSHYLVLFSTIFSGRNKSSTSRISPFSGPSFRAGWPWRCCEGWRPGHRIFQWSGLAFKNCRSANASTVSSPRLTDFGAMNGPPMMASPPLDRVV